MKKTNYTEIKLSKYFKERYMSFFMNALKINSARGQ